MLPARKIHPSFYPTTFSNSLTFWDGQIFPAPPRNSDRCVPKLLIMRSHGLLVACVLNKARKVNTMLWYAWVFLVVALLAALLGFGGIAAAAAGIAKICFVVFLVLFIVSVLAGRRSAI